MLKPVIRALVPYSIRATLKSFHTLSFKYGQFRTAQTQASIDANGRPIPWYTYPAIDYIRQLDFSDCTLFEYGSGNSTIFWSERCKKVVSVEDDQNWFELTKSKLSSSVDYQLIKNKTDYIQHIHSYDTEFDIIVIDGKYRDDCTIEALKKIHSGSMVIIDNSEWFPASTQLLRENDLIQIDMAGFAPILACTSNTSFFLGRDIKLTPSGTQLPEIGLGGSPPHPDIATW